MPSKATTRVCRSCRQVINPAVMFWENVDVRGPLDCWPWKLGDNGNGYGNCSRATYGDNLAHRVAWALVNGSIPRGLAILHSCDFRRCCNPRHLRPGTALQNSADAIERGRWTHGERTGGAKLTRAAVIEIRTTTGPLRVMAEKHGVSISAVSLIRRKKTWKDVA